MWSSISPEDWDWLKALISDSASPRELIERCRGQKPHLVDALLRMLAASDADSTALLTTAGWGSMFAPGDLISDRYEVEASIGVGGMGEVYRVRDRHWPRRGSLALKTIRTGLAGNAEALSRFEHEVRNALEVAHPNVCRIYDVGRHDASGRTLPYLTMEYLQGPTLSAHLNSTGPLGEAKVLPIIRQLAAGLAAIHARGIVHRDFKPGNIILVPESEGFRAVITDFGLARAVEDAANTVITRAGAAVGTIAYMAPEQLSGDMAVSCAADVYSFGVTAHEILTGKRYCAGTPDGLDKADASPALRATVRRCIQIDRARRLQRGADVVAALSATEASGATVLERAPRAIPVRTIIALPALAVVVALAWLAWARMSEPRLPAAAVPLMNQAMVKYFDSSFYDASKLLEKVTSLAPDYPLAHAMLADSWNELESTLKAQQQILRITNASSASGDDRLFIEGVRDTLMHDYNDAAKAYRSWYASADAAAKPGRAVVLGRALQRAQKPDEAAKAYEAAGRYGAALLALGDLNARAEKKQLAISEFDQARSEFRERGEYGSIAAVDYAHGSALTRWNRSSDAKDMLQRCVDDARTTGNDYDMARCRLQLATLEVREAKTEADLARSNSDVAAALDNAGMLGFRILAARSWLALGQIDAMNERYPNAQRDYAEAIARGRDEGSARLIAQVEVARSDLLQRLRDDADAEKEARAAFAYFKSEHSTKEAAQAAVVLSRALRNEENYDEAVRILGDKALLGAGPLERQQLDESAASILYQQRDYPAAFARYQAIVAELPPNIDQTPYLVSAALSQASIGFLDDASATLDRVAKRSLTPLNKAMLRIARGWIDLYRVRYDRAYAELAGDASDEPQPEARGLALAGMGRFAESLALCDDSGPAGAREKASIDFCAARALLGLHRAGEAAARISKIEAAGLSSPEFAWQVAALGAETDLAMGDAPDEHRRRARDLLDSLRTHWGDANFQKYLARPDVAAEIRRAGLRVS